VQRYTKAADRKRTRLAFQTTAASRHVGMFCTKRCERMRELDMRVEMLKRDNAVDTILEWLK